MGKKRIAVAIYVLIGIIIFTFSAFLFYKYIRRWVRISQAHHRKLINSNQIQEAIALNKKMLSCYMKDINEYRKLGITKDNPIITFSYDKVIRLTIALSELHKQLNGETESNLGEYIKRLERMYEINEQSINQFRHELSQLRADNVAPDNPYMLFAQSQISTKTKTLYQIARILKKY